jgi:hypothetical protein
MSRWLYPTSSTLGAGVAAATDTRPSAGPIWSVINNFNNVGKPVINPLKATTGTSYVSGTTTTTLWARSANDNKAVDQVFNFADELDVYTEYLTAAADAPTPTYPTNDALIPVNSINGNVVPFNFTWNAPKSIADTGIGVNYNYQIGVYLDEAGTSPIANLVTPFAPGVVSTQLAYPSTTGGWVFTPGQTHYWRVRVLAGNPLQSYWSPMQSFAVEQLVAIVPVIASPANGGEVTTVTPAFSWSPISNTTSYRFELASDAAFTDVIYTVDPTTAGAAVPSSLSLDRGAQYYWHVKALTPMEGEWSATANFIVAQLPTEQAPPVIVTSVPAPTITAIITQPPAITTQIVIPPAEVKEVNPSYIWAIIIVGAVLVIAVIILIVRTRRSV